MQEIGRRRSGLARLVAVAVLLSASAGPVAITVARAQSGGQPFLLALRGETVMLNYTPGALDRAVHVQQRLELLGSDFERWAGAEAQLRVFVLSREEWGKFGFHLPYGLPGRIRGSTLAVPSFGDAGTVRLWTDIRGFPPPPLPGIPMKGTAEEAATLAFSDLVMEVEAARVLLAVGGIRGTVTWLHQVLAHLMARRAFDRYEEGRMVEIDAFFEGLGRGVQGPLPLDRYAQGLDLETLLWFESRFYDGARAVMATGKKNHAKALVKRAKKNGGALTEEIFFELYPEMRGWLAETFPPAAAATAAPGG